METYTLIIWLMMGQRYEETHLPLLYPVQCTVFRDEMLRERSPVRAECVADPPPRPSTPYEYLNDRCLICPPNWPTPPPDEPTPGHKRI